MPSSQQTPPYTPPEPTGVPELPIFPAAQFVPQPTVPAQPTVTIATTAPAAPKPSRFSMASVLKTVAVLAVLIVVYLGGIYTSVSTSRIAKANATKTARGLIAALNQGDASQAYNLTSSNLQHQQSVSQFASALGNLTSSKPKLLKSSVTFNDRLANYSELEDGLPTDGGGHSTATWTITLVKSGLFDWKVDGVRVE